MTECPDSEELLAKVREKIMKCKCISLEELGFEFIANPRYLNKRDKDKLVKTVEKWMTKSDEEIDLEFNSLVCDKWLASGRDVSHFPVYDIAGNKVADK